jgi:hypothetical protein
VLRSTTLTHVHSAHASSPAATSYGLARCCGDHQRAALLARGAHPGDIAPAKRSVSGLALGGVSRPYAAGLDALARRAAPRSFWGALVVLCGLTAACSCPSTRSMGGGTVGSGGIFTWALTVARPARRRIALLDRSRRRRRSQGVDPRDAGFLARSLGGFSLVLLVLRMRLKARGAGARSCGASSRSARRGARDAFLVFWYWMSTGSPAPVVGITRRPSAPTLPAWRARLGEVRNGLAESLPGACRPRRGRFLALGEGAAMPRPRGLAAATCFSPAAARSFPFAPPDAGGERYTSVLRAAPAARLRARAAGRACVLPPTRRRAFVSR